MQIDLDQFKMSDAELEAIGGEVHRMFHAGASEKEGLERLKTRLSRGRYDELPRLLRPLFNRMVKTCLDGIWGAEHCGPGHDTVICDAPAVQ